MIVEERKGGRESERQVECEKEKERERERKWWEVEKRVGEAM